MNVLLVPVGSHGDVHPFVGLAAALRDRGHRTTVITNGHFEPLVRKVGGIGFSEIGTTEEYRSLIADAELWHATRGWKVVFRNTVGDLMRRAYDRIAELNEPGDTVLVGSSLALGARVARDALGIPMASVHLQPGILRTEFDMAKMPNLWLPRWLPRWVKRGFWSAADRFILDPFAAPPVNAFRAEKGLPPVRRLLHEWWHSPDLVVGLFPEWYAAPQPDWPPQTRLTGFPMFDERGLEKMPAELDAFVAADDWPVAFTPGSANMHGRGFFDAAVDACRRLGRRGLLLTRLRNQLPPDLPAGVRHFDYAPFSELLPRCAALVHHGGIGTTAQALAAGVPQLVMPMSHDQPDNAARVKRLGVGDWLSPKAFAGPKVAERLRRLIKSNEVAACCRKVAARFEGVRPIDETCDLIERLLPTQRDHFPAAAALGAGSTSS